MKKKIKMELKLLGNLIIALAIVIITKNSIKPQVITKVEIEREIITIEIEKQEQPKEKEIAFNNSNEKNIYNKCLEQGLTKEQAMLLISISKHETGTWTSKAFINDNNFGGIMNNGELKHYNSYEEGLNDFVRILKTYYFEKGLNTIEEIGAKYCPVGAANDPNGLNKYWVGSVSRFYNYYLTLI